MNDVQTVEYWHYLICCIILWATKPHARFVINILSILTVMNNLTINYGTETSPELSAISYEDANAVNY